VFVALNKKSLVVQSNKLIEARYRLSVEEQKIIKILISQIRKDDKDFQDYEFRIKDLAELLGMTYDNPYVALRRITKRLITRPLEFENPETGELLQTAWLSSARYRAGEGVVSLHFDPSLKPLLLQLQSYFTKYELENVLRFTGQYAIRFFEFQKSYLGQNKKEIVLGLAELRIRLGLRKDEYEQFSDFKRRVLEPARIELLEKTGKSFHWEPVRRGVGGKIVGIRCTFDENSETQEALKAAEPELPKEELGSPVVGELRTCGVSLRKAQEIVAAHPAEKVREKIAMIKRHGGEFRNRAGFLVRAITEDWSDEEIEQRKREKECRRAEKERREQEAREQAAQRIADGFRSYRMQRARELAAGLPEEEKARIVKNYSDKGLFSIFRKRPEFDLGSGVFLAHVMGEIADRLPTLGEYLQETGTALTDTERAAVEQTMGHDNQGN
jgi:plasmid replication initiation protein